MQNELDKASSNQAKLSNTGSPKKYLVSPEKSAKSRSTRDSELTEGSKRSTEEEELRSLSTTPRYSHEDLGRIVSPPHSSDYDDPPADKLASDSADEDNTPDGGDTLSAQQVYLKSRTSQFTRPRISDKGSVNSEQSHTIGYSDQAWTKPAYPGYKKDFVSTDISSEQSLHSQPFNTSFAARGKDSTKSAISSTTISSDLKLLKTKREIAIKKVNLKKSGLKSTGNKFDDRDRLRSTERPDHNKVRSTERPDYNRLRAAELLEMRMTGVDNSLQEIMTDAETVQRDLSNEQDHRLMLEKRLKEVEEEKKELNAKLAALRVKFGVASSNYNVSKNESDQMRKKHQETQIQQARLEERIQTCTRDLERLKDPNNPDSNVNLKKIVMNDRKEIRRLKTELEGIRSERSDVQKQIQNKDEKIKMLNIYIAEANDQLEDCNRDYEVAQISVVGEKKKREEVEIKYNELMKEKSEFDSKMAEIQSLLDKAVSGSTGIQKQADDYKEKEKALESKIEIVEKKLRETLIAVEQEKNRDMPFRTSTSIKHHQYRMSNTGMVTDTTPHVVVTTNTNASIGASGFLGKTVVSTKPVSTLPGGKSGPKSTPRSKGGSLPAKK